MALNKAQLQNMARPDIVFRILVGQDPDDYQKKTAMVIKNGELWFAISGDKRDWNKRKTARAIAECCKKIIEDYCKKEFEDDKV